MRLQSQKYTLIVQILVQESFIKYTIDYCILFIWNQVQLMVRLWITTKITTSSTSAIEYFITQN